MALDSRMDLCFTQIPLIMGLTEIGNKELALDSRMDLCFTQVPLIVGLTEIGNKDGT